MPRAAPERVPQPRAAPLFEAPKRCTCRLCACKFSLFQCLLLMPKIGRTHIDITMLRPL
nr:MAG TPA: hypothetical protein [Caudoviricetes sp.]